YQYMVIGNFRNNTATEAVMGSPSTVPWGGINSEWSIYYLIDEVSVVPNCPADVYLGGCNTQGFFDINDPIDFGPEPYDLLSTLTSSISNAYSIFIDYPILVDVNYSFSQQELIFGPYGKLIVPSGKTLNINDSYLHGCYSMW